MSVRGYFEQRNLIPGTVFILFVGAFNYTLALNLASQESALIGIVGILIGSPAIGFLISQCWYWYLQRSKKIYAWLPVKKMVMLYELEKMKPQKVLVIYDYILHHGLHSSKEGLSSYAFRRYDNYVLLNVTLISVISGSILGVLLRILREFYPTPAYRLEVILNYFLQSQELIVGIFLIIIVALLSFFLTKGIIHVKAEYDELHTAVIVRAYSQNNPSWQEIIDVFPDYFEKNGLPKI